MAGRTFAIGDIHGCYKTFYTMLFDVLKITSDDEVYLLGDYIDRGPSSKEVVDLIIYLIEKKYKINPILGNHEFLLLSSLNSYDMFLEWQINGANNTLSNFKIKHIRFMEEKYIRFFREMKYFYLLEKFIIVHAGMDFSENPFENKVDMLWSRSPYVDKRKTGGRRLVCGHTPTSKEKIIQSLNNDKILLDGGCVYIDRFPGMGNLAALELNSLELFFQINIDSPSDSTIV
jgi:serine/threonine protein phosphatase 1